MTWQPIPKEYPDEMYGTYYLVYCPKNGNVNSGCLNHDGIWEIEVLPGMLHDIYDQPSHYMDLPNPPEEK